MSVRDTSILIDVLRSTVPPRWIIDHEVRISEAPTFVWISLRGSQIETVTKDDACRGQREDFKRPFPVPDLCKMD